MPEPMRPLLVTVAEADLLKRLMRRKVRGDAGIEVRDTPDGIAIALRTMRRRDPAEMRGFWARVTGYADGKGYDFRQQQRKSDGSGWEDLPGGISSDSATGMVSVDQKAIEASGASDVATGDNGAVVWITVAAQNGEAMPVYVFSAPGRLMVALCKVTEATSDDTGGYTTTGDTECSNSDNYGGPSSDTTATAKDPASCGFKYEIYGFDQTTRLDDEEGDGLTPDKPRVSGIEYYKPADYSPCLVYYDDSGTLKLLEAIEERPKGYTGTKQSYRAQWVTGGDGTQRLVNEVWDEVFADGLLVGRYQRCNELVVDGDPECDTA